jgi:hypothetical protein
MRRSLQAAKPVNVFMSVMLNVTLKLADVLECTLSLHGTDILKMMMTLTNGKLMVTSTIQPS